MTRRSKQDWLEFGLKTLGEVGRLGLTIDVMTERYNVTKGSFYHHFESATDFEEQLLAHWADQYLSTSESLPENPQERLALLDFIMEETFTAITEPEIAIRSWARHDMRAASYVQAVDEFRRRIVAQMFKGLLGDKHQEELIADMLFTISIGSLATFPRIPPERVLEIYRELRRQYAI